MVSPVAKNGGDIRGILGDSGGGVVQASPNGQGITYVSLASFGEPQGASIGSQYVSHRSEAGWATQNISIPMSAQSYPPTAGEGTPYRAFSSNLSSGLVWGGPRGPRGFFEGPPLAGAPPEYENYYLAGIPSGALRSLLSRIPTMPADEFRLEFLGATPNLEHVVVASPAALGTGTIEVSPGHNLYEWEQATGQFQPVNILPDGVDEGNALFGGGIGVTDRAVSVDGSSVVWTSLEGVTSLYVRDGIGTAHPSTVQADAPLGGGQFLTASSDDSKIFFGDNNRLTGDSTASSSGLGDLYRFEPRDEGNGRLVDLTVDHVDPGGAEVLGVLGASTDGSYLYFVANGRLDSSVPGVRQGNCTTGRSPAGATCNLYLWHEGWATPRFIATLSGNDQFEESGFSSLGFAFDWDPSLDLRTARVSSDGNQVVFMSQESLTGYDNTVSTSSSCGTSFDGVSLPAQCEEVFLYEASTNRLTCVSCNPTGAQPTGPSGIPGGTQISNNQAIYQSRVLSEEGGMGNAGEGVSGEGGGGSGEGDPGGAGGDGGRVFFDSADGIVPQDTNGAEDVYEYENGNIYLISDGTNAGGASFVDASTDGDDVFFITRAQLAAQDTDQLVDLYDARAPHVPGERVGFAAVSPTVCEGEECRSPSPGAPAFASPSSATFMGAGNVAAPAPVVTPKRTQKKKPRKATKKKAKPRRAKRGRARAGVAHAGVGRRGKGRL
jgi:hypothetical protein